MGHGHLDPRKAKPGDVGNSKQRDPARTGSREDRSRCLATMEGSESRRVASGPSRRVFTVPEIGNLRGRLLLAFLPSTRKSSKIQSRVLGSQVESQRVSR